MENWRRESNTVYLSSGTVRSWKLHIYHILDFEKSKSRCKVKKIKHNIVMRLRKTHCFEEERFEFFLYWAIAFAHIHFKTPSF